MIDTHLVWAPAVMTAAYFGHRVVIRYIDAQEKKNIRDEHRDERDRGVVVECMNKVEALEAEMRSTRTEVKAALANLRSR